MINENFLAKIKNSEAKNVTLNFGGCSKNDKKDGKEGKDGDSFTAGSCRLAAKTNKFKF